MNSFRAIAAAAALMTAALAAPAFAANNVSAQDAAGATFTACSLDTGSGVQATCHVNVDSSGAKIDPATAQRQDAAKAALDQLHNDILAPSFVNQDAAVTTGTISAADAGSTTISGMSGVTLVTGTPTANSFVTWPINARSAMGLTITQAGTYALAVEGSADGGATYAPITGLIRGTNVRTSTLTGPAIASFDLAGFDHVRVRATSYTSGSPVAKAVFSSAAGLTKLLNGVSLIDSGGSDISDLLAHAVQTQAGGYSIMPSPTITVQAAAYAAGNSEGGLLTVPAARYAGGSATITTLAVQSKGGSTNTISAYLFAKNPTATTCTDKTAFVLGAADRPYLIGGAPQTLTPGTINPTTGDTATYAPLSNLTLNFKNQDSTPGQNLYACLVTAGAVTPASTSDLLLELGGLQ